MSLKLSDLIPSAERVERTVLGQTFMLRGVSGPESALIDAAFEKPQPPVVDKKHDFDNPGYVAELELWWHQTKVAAAAIATGHTCSDGTTFEQPEPPKSAEERSREVASRFAQGATPAPAARLDKVAKIAWLKKAVGELEGLSSTLIKPLHAEIQMLSVPISSAVLEAARGK